MNIPTIGSLQVEKDIKHQRQLEIFGIVLHKCVEKITYTNRHTQKSYIMFDVPSILIGYPTYNMKMCINFLISNFSKKDYKIEFIEPNLLYIDWGTCNVPASKKSVLHSGSSNSKLSFGKIKVNDQEKLLRQTKKLIGKFPNVLEISYHYAD
jgi:hypothetical protein